MDKEDFKYKLGEIPPPLWPPHTPLEDIRFITLIRYRVIEDTPQFSTLRLESFPVARWENWWRDHKNGILDAPFKVNKITENYNHQELYEFKQKLANIYEEQSTIDERNAKFQELLEEISTEIKFEVE